jgi:hypothetical protein
VMSLNALFAALPGYVTKALNFADAQHAIANQYGVQFVTYESGQSLAGYGGVENDAAVTALFTAANRDPRMYGIVKSLHDGWWQRGGGLMNAFRYTGRESNVGSWGYLEYQNQPLTQAPKYRALVDSINGGGALGTP